MMKEPESKK